MERTPLGVAVVGAGYWGPNLVRNFYSSDDWSVRCVIEPDRGRRERLTRFYPSIAGYAEIDAALEDPRVDAVALATPPRTHYPLAVRAIEAGKHVLVEKPLAETFRDAQDLCERAQRAGLCLLADHTFLYTGSDEERRAVRAAPHLCKVHWRRSGRPSLWPLQASRVVRPLAPQDRERRNELMSDMPC